MTPKFRISQEDFAARKLMIATPMYGGQCHGLYTTSLLDVSTALLRNGQTLEHRAVYNDSCVARARNTLVEAFLQTDCTHLLFWDADIEAKPDDVVGLMILADPASDKDVVCGLYPKKHIRWDKIAAAANAGWDHDKLEQFGGDYVFNPVGLSGEHDLYSLLDVAECGTGFMMIQRRVLDAFKAAYPDRRYKSTEGSEGYTTAYFLDEIDPASQRFLTEDYNFCRLLRLIGQKIWVAPWMGLNHIGSFKFVGNPAAVSSLVKPAAAAA